MVDALESGYEAEVAPGRSPMALDGGNQLPMEARPRSKSSWKLRDKEVTRNGG
jgi:hypothetical protein